MYTVYLLTNKINNKMYVGATNNFKKRMREHKVTHNNSLISRAIKKYGWNNFSQTILATTEERNQAFDILEKGFIAEYNTTNPCIGYNLTAGGGGHEGYVVSQETRLKQRNAKIGIPLSDNHKENMKMSKIGTKLSEETKTKISEKLKGNKNSLGVKHTKESLSNMKGSNAKTFTVINPEGYKMTVHNMSDFCIANGLSKVCMCRVMSGKQMKHKGWTKATS